ncbi:MAG: hypothetical protein ABMA64_25220 [Myxococcota bacterium]
MLGWWFAAHASEPCSIRVDAERIDAALERIEASWAALDDLEFVRGVDELHLLLPCVTEVVPPGTAARIHRAYALESWVRGATADGVVALAAARQIEPGWPEPPGWFPEALAAAAAESPGASRAVPPRDGGLVFDGTPDARRPERPSFVQWVGGDGDVRASWYVRPDEPLPDYDPAYKSRRNLVSLGVAGVVAGGAAYGAAFAVGAGLERTRDLDEARAVQARANTLTVGSAALLGVGCAGLGLGWTVGR